MPKQERASAPTEPPPPPDTLDAAPEKTPREWAAAKGTPGWHLAAAAAGEVWPTDKILSETAFDSAITRALSAKAG